MDGAAQQSKLATLNMDMSFNMANWQTVAELQDISADLPHFTQALTELSTRLGLDITGTEADHISLRCHQNTTAERWRRGFEQCGELLSENIINGRPICLLNCMSRFVCNIGNFPSSNCRTGRKRYPHEGWEHIEIVLPGEAQTLNARALALLSDHGLSQPRVYL